MRISAKGRYAIASMITLTKYQTDQPITVASISNKLNISKIYLEQIFSLLKHSRLVTSSKGAQGGYQLAKPSSDISVLDILSATELTLLEKMETTMEAEYLPLEKVMQTHIFDPLDQAVAAMLSSVRLDQLADELTAANETGNYMFFI